MDNKQQPKSPDILFASARASVHFALTCLEPVGNYQRAKSTFVNPYAEIMHWHDFGNLEGPGWAANAIGGAQLLYEWGKYTKDKTIQQKALQLTDHILEDGFIRADGFIWPYWDLEQETFCANYTHNNTWLCPGSLARIGVQMLDFAKILNDKVYAPRLQLAAWGLGEWLAAHVPLLDNGWVPRRITLTGDPYPLTPAGGPDPIYSHSADGLYLLELWAVSGHRNLALKLGNAFLSQGGFWGSLNHDTFDNHENVA